METISKIFNEISILLGQILGDIKRYIKVFLEQIYLTIGDLSKELIITILLFVAFLNFILVFYILRSKKKKKGEPSISDIMRTLPVKICYWQNKGVDFFVHEDIPLLLKSSLQGYSLIHFILNYNQDIQNQFTKLQNGMVSHFNNLITALNVEITVYKYSNYFFLTVQKVNKNSDTLIRSALNEMPNNMTWIEVEGEVIFRNNLCERYKTLVNILSTNKNNDNGKDNNIISIDNILYKYNRYLTASYTINMLNEINEFKTFHQDEKNKKLIYTFLSFLKEKFLILDRDGKITLLSEGLKTLINLDKETNVYDIADLIQVMKNNLSLPEEIDLQSYIENYKKKINQCEEIESDYFTSLEGRVFSRTIFPKNSHVMIAFEDISQQIANEKEYLQNKNLQNIYLNYLEEGVVVFESNGKLMYHNDAILNFISESYLANVSVFEANLVVKIDDIYTSTSIKKDELFTLVKNNIEGFQAYVIKPYYNNSGQNIEYFHNMLQEVDNQWRYLEYVKSQEKNIRSLEQIALVFKSLHRVKIFTASNVDYYDDPKVITNEDLDLVLFIKALLERMSGIYNIKSFNIQYLGDSYMAAVDKTLLERALLYFFDFFSSFFLVSDKSINVQLEEEIFVLSMHIKQKFDFKNPVGTRLIFVMQKLFKLMKFTVNLVDDEDKFSFLITYDKSH